jgi:hypothetical protein
MDDVYKSMNKDIGSGAIPEESARYQTAQNLPVPVPMTPGDISGDKSRQLLENGIETGRFGDSAERKMAALRNDQNIAIKDNMGEIQQQMAEPKQGLTQLLEEAKEHGQEEVVAAELVVVAPKGRKLKLR